MFSLKSWVRRWRAAGRPSRIPLTRRPDCRLRLEALETRDTPAPLVQIVGAPANSPEGTAITLGSQVTDPEGVGPYTYAWSVTKNGVAFTTGTPANGSSFTFTPDDNGTYVASLTVTAPDGQTATANTGSTAPTDVLIIYDVNNTHTQSLKTALQQAGFNVSLTSQDETWFNGSNPSLAPYEAVIHLNGVTWTQAMPDAGQAALRDYVQNGGAYLGSEWSAYEVRFGNMGAMRDLVLFDYQSEVSSSTSLNLTDAAGQSGHPILANVGSPISFTAGALVGSAHTFATQPVTVLMQDQFNSAAVAVREFGTGRVVGFHNSGNYGSGTALSDPDLQQLYIDGVRWAARPASGGGGVTITVTNVAPTATLTDNDPVNEGGVPVTVTFSNPSDPSPIDTQQGFRYSFATSAAGLAASYAAAGTATSAQFTFPDSGTYTVFGRVFDKDGFRDYQTTVIVTNIAPTAVLSDNDPVATGAPVTLAFTGATDPSPADTTAGFRYSFATSQAGLATTYAAAGTSATGQLTYATAGTYTAYGRIFDKDGGFRDYTTSVTVFAALQVAITGAPANSPEGTTLTLGSTITDPLGQAPYTYAWSVTRNGSAYATGTPTNGESFTFTPNDNGTYVVSLVVTAADGRTSSGTTATPTADVLILSDVLPINTPTQALKTALEAAGFNVSVATSLEYLYTGNNPFLTPYEAVIHLDGITWSSPMPTAGQQALNSYVQNGGAFIGSEWLSYEAGSHSFMRDLILFDYFGEGSGSVTYTDVAAQAGHPVLANVPSSFTFTSGRGLTTAHTFATNPVTVLMRDQTGRDAVAIRDFGGGRVVEFNHSGNYAGAATLGDPNVQKLYIDGVRWAARLGGPGSNAATVTVTNVAPSATLTTNGPVTELTPVTFTFSDVTDPSSADSAAGFRYSFSTSSNGLATSYAAASTSPTGQITPLDDGNVTFFTRVFDKDGGFRDYQTAVTVTNVAPTATITNNGPVAEGVPVTVSLINPVDSTSDRSNLRYSFSISSNGLATSYAAAGTASSQQFTFPVQGTYTVFARVFDNEGASTDYQTTVTVLKLASISGTLFEDFDADGVRDPNEPGHGGVTVYLDLNRNGVRDASGAVEPVAVTNAQGNYTFPSLLPGTYVVREVLPPNYRQTLPGPGIANPGPGVFFGTAYDAQGQLRLAEIDAVTGKVTRIGNPMATRMHGLVMTNDGLLYGVSWPDNSFYSVNRTTGQTTRIGAAGMALVGGLAYDRATDTIYGLGVTIPGPTPAQNTISLIVFNRTTGAATPFATGITGMSGTSGLAFDAVRGRVLALDNDDRQVYAFDVATGAATLLSVLPVGTTGWGLAFDGQYAVVGRNVSSNTLLGYYDPDTGALVRSLTMSEPATVEALEFIRTEPFTRRVAVGTAETVTGIDFGNQNVLGSIGGTLFEDFDADGVRDPNEPGHGGVTVYLDLNRNGVRDASGAVEPVAVTNAQGNYTFPSLLPGTYVVREVLPPNYRQTLPGPGIANEGQGVFFGTAYNAQGQMHLAEIDATTGRVTRIGAAQATRMHGMVMTNDGTLYGVNGFATNDGLYRVNRTTGQPTLIGLSGYELSFGLAYDSATDTIYGLGYAFLPGNTEATVYLLTFDRTTGAATPIGTPGFVPGLSGTSGVTFDSVNNRVLALDNNDHEVYAFDLTTGAGTLLTTLPSNSFGWDIAFVDQDLVVGRNGSLNTTFAYYDLTTGAQVGVLNLSEPATVEALTFVRSEPFTRRVTVGTAQAVTGIDFGNNGPNRGPVANAGGPYTVTEGQGLTLNASGSSDVEGGALSYAWDLDGDSQFDDATGVAPTLTWDQLAAFGIADDGTYTIRVRVTDTDPDGSLSSTASATVTVLNAAPTVAFTLSAATINEGGSVTASGTVTDAGPLDTHTVTIAWGDGTTSVAAVNADRTFAASHVYRDDNPTGTASDVYQVGIAVRDDNGGTGGVGVQELVTNGGFESGNFSGWTVTANGAAQWVINNGTADPTGPGTPTAPIAGQFDALAQEGSPSTLFLSEPITVPANVGSAVLSWSDRIRNFGPSFADPTQEWRVRIVSLAGGVLREVYSTNPGDALQQLVPNRRSFDLTSFFQGLSGQTVRVSFELQVTSGYFNVNLDDVSLLVTTEPGVPVTVTNVAPTAPVLQVSPAVGEDGTVTLTGTFTDAGADDTHTVTVTWGDGTQTVLGGGATVPVSQAVEYNGHRYYVVRQQGLSWFEAQEQAQRLGGNLVTINDAAENTFVSELLRSNFGYYALAWIGYSDEATEGQFEWESGESTTYTNWFVRDGEPNDYPPAVTEDFAITNYAYGYGPGWWNDLSGTRDSGVYWGAYAVVEVNPTRTFTLSHRYADDNAIDAYTIGVTVTDDDTGTSSATATATMTNSAPTNLTVTADAVTINEDGSVTLTGSFADRGTLDSHTVTIDWKDGTTSQVTVPAFPGTPSAGVNLAASAEFGGHTYHFISTPLSWDAAEAEARRMGGHLVTINSTAENVFLLEYIRRSALTGDVQTWIGLSDGGTDGPFRWSSGEALAYTAWAAGEPGNPAGATGIAFNYNNTQIGARWGDFAAGTPLFAVIEVDGTRTFSANHRYLDDNPTGTPSDVYSIGVTVTDDDGGSASASVPVAVNNVAPVIGSLTGPVAGTPTVATPTGGAVTFTGVRGQPLAFSVAFTDAGTLDAHEAQWDFGDGTTTAWLPAAAHVGKAPAHIYTAAGTYTVTVTVRDDDGGTVSFTRQVEIKAIELQADPNDPTKTSLVVGGTIVSDDIQVEAGATAGSVEVFVNGASLGTYAPTGSVTVFAQAGDDDVKVAGGVTLPAWLYGGAGNDRMKGGAGNDVLLGGDGDDLLLGGAGRDFVIAGVGADRVIGNADEDVLIAGWTAYDDDRTALGRLRGVWLDPDQTYEQRVAALRSADTLPDGIRLASGTLFHDTAIDVLTGGGGQDWFVLDSSRDRATDINDDVFDPDRDFIENP